MKTESPYIYEYNEGQKLLFESYCRQWKEETAGYSSLPKKLLNEWYLRIISLGRGIVPLIIKELQHDPDQWFLALKVLTFEDPIEQIDEKDSDIYYGFDGCVQAWLEWAKRNNINY